MSRFLKYYVDWGYVAVNDAGTYAGIVVAFDGGSTGDTHDNFLFPMAAFNWC